MTAPAFNTLEAANTYIEEVHEELERLRAFSVEWKDQQSRNDQFCRDMFAASALKGLLSNSNYSHCSRQNINDRSTVSYAWKIAQQMMEERAKCY